MSWAGSDRLISASTLKTLAERTFHLVEQTLEGFTGHLMLNFGIVGPRVEETLELYFQQCSVLVSCHDLAVMGATLANRGINPVTGVRAIEEEHVKDVLAIMYTCGMYDFSGEWAYRVGLPAKSGVSGGIVAVVPGKLAIGVFSPRLDARCNSVRGIKVARIYHDSSGCICSNPNGRSLFDRQTTVLPA